MALKRARQPIVGERVRVYRNLHNGRISVRAAEGVIYHAFNIILSDVKFQVWKSGREKVLREKKKNVHAFAVGTIKSFDVEGSFNGTFVGYNPYKYDYFFIKNSEQRIDSAGSALVTASGIILADPLCYGTGLA